MSKIENIMIKSAMATRGGNGGGCDGDGGCGNGGDGVGCGH